MTSRKRKAKVLFTKRGWILICIGCAIVCAAGIWAVNYFTCTPEKAGVFGDSAGAINALFSSLAFAGVIIAMYLQRKELRLQRLELRLQRKELKATHEQLKAQKEEFHIQNETLKRQRFENTFFQMMSLQQEIVNGLKFSYEEPRKTITQDRDPVVVSAKIVITNTTSETMITKTLTGRDIFYWLFDKERIIIRNNKGSDSIVNGLKGAIRNKRTINVYDTLEHPKYFDHYFRHLYRIAKFVDDSELIDNQSKYEYIGMIRGTLSRYEMVWLFYNCLSANGVDKFKPLVEKYSLLRGVRKELLASDTHVNLYGEGAYECLYDI